MDTLLEVAGVVGAEFSEARGAGAVPHTYAMTHRVIVGKPAVSVYIRRLPW